VAAQLLHDLADDELRVAPNVQPSDPYLNNDVQAVDERFILSHIVRGGELEADHVPHAHSEGGNEDESHADALLHQQAIKVHHLVLLIDSRQWHLDLGPLRDEVSQHLGLDSYSGRR
jgi:hypothetical protein